MDVEIRQATSGKGKGLFSKKFLKNCTTIFQEEPLVSCQFSWNAAYKYKACDHCLRPLETAEQNARRLAGYQVCLPRPECCETDLSSIVSCDLCGLSYCSEECKNIAWSSYHETLCLRTQNPTESHPLVKLNETWKRCHYPPETNSVMLIIRLLARIVQSQDKNAAVAETLQFCHRTVNEDADLAHQLLGEKFASQLNALYECFVEAAPKDDAIKNFLSLEWFQKLLALIGTNGQGIGTSALSRWVSNISELSVSDEERQDIDAFIDNLYDQIEETSGTFLNNEGVGLYRLQSTCNHSCDPNAQPQFLNNNHQLSLVAIKDIAEGEEIVISYLDECMLQRSRHSRRKELMKNYLFLCDCEKCRAEADQEDVTSESEEDGDEEMSE